MLNKSSPPPAGAQAEPLDRPDLCVLRGQPTETELAAVVAVLAVRAAAATALASAPGPAGASHSAWSDRSRLLREPIAPGRGGWRASALPR